MNLFLARRVAVLINLETGKSIQEILSEYVSAIQGGRVPFPVALCPICASKIHKITSTKTYDTEIVRYHSCDFCTGTFVSEEKRLVKIPTTDQPTIAKPKKKPHIKKRGA